MSDVQSSSEGTAPVQESAAPKVDKNAWAERVICEILRLMKFAARLEVKDAADGGISVAIFFEEEVPGVQPGKRSHVLDSLQFIANKIVNRPQTERRWISLGIGGHPAPRPALDWGARAPRTASPSGPPAPRPNGQAGPALHGEAPRSASAEGAAPELSAQEPAPDPAVTGVARALAEKSARLGRFFAISPLKPADQVRFVKGGSGISGVTVRIEGEGRHRRVVFAPERPTPMPKRSAMPDYGDDAD